MSLDLLGFGIMGALVRLRSGPTALEALAMAAYRRVDLVMLGDSNQLFQWAGFDHGFNVALNARFGTYATAIYGINPGPTYARQGVTMTDAYDVTFGQTTGATAPQEAAALASVGYGRVADGATLLATFGNGIQIRAGSALDFTSRVRYHLGYWTFATGAGEFRGGIMSKQAPNPKTYFGSGKVYTNTGTEGFVVGTWELPPDPTRVDGYDFTPLVPNAYSVVGPFVGFFHRVEDAAKDNGVSVHSLYSVGGAGLRDCAAQMLAYPIEQLGNYFAEVRRLQIAKGLKPVVVVYANFGLNDRNKIGNDPSLGPRASTDPDSPVAYLDNLEALTARIGAVWQARGWDESELFFLVIPSHPVSLPDDAELASYREVARAFASGHPRTSVVDLSNLTNHDELLLNGWYYPIDGSEPAHLTEAGYEALAARVVALVP
jgi:hypothetical protein